MQFALHIALLNKYCEDHNYENPYKIFSYNPFKSIYNFFTNLFKQ